MENSYSHRGDNNWCYVGNLDDRVNEDLLWELMNQVGPVNHVNMPRDKVTGSHQNYGFVEYNSADDVNYAIKVLNMIRLYGKPIKVNTRSTDIKHYDVGANLFIGGLSGEVDESILYNCFSSFGNVIKTPKIAVDSTTGLSKGHGFVSFDCFESSDLAIRCMNGQYLGNKPIHCYYAYKHDVPGERYGTEADRLLAAKGKQFNTNNTNANQPKPPPPPSISTSTENVPKSTSRNTIPMTIETSSVSNLPSPPPPPPLAPTE
tara:strand:+ start:2323 stop:3105 length:783 start_codon:yes stop_codon:yes gene_type:complete